MATESVDATQERKHDFQKRRHSITRHEEFQTRKADGQAGPQGRAPGYSVGGESESESFAKIPEDSKLAKSFSSIEKSPFW